MKIIIGFFSGMKDPNCFIVSVLFQQPIDFRQLLMRKVQNPLLEFLVKLRFDPRHFFASLPDPL